jgi:hypothetical protein
MSVRKILARPAAVDEPARQTHLLLLEPREDVHGETQVGLLRRAVGRVGRVSDHGQRAGLSHQRVEPGPGGQPVLDDIIETIERLGCQPLVVGGHIVPGGVAECLGGGGKVDHQGKG